MTDGRRAVRSLVGPGSLLQGTVPADRRLLSLVRVRRLEAVVLDSDAPVLRHYHRDQTRPDRPWVRGEVVSERASGPGVLVQEPGTWRRPGTLHAFVPEPDGVAHYARDTAWGRSSRWHRVGQDVARPGLAAGAEGGVSPVLAEPCPADADLRALADRVGAVQVVALASCSSTLASGGPLGALLAALPGGGGSLARPTTEPGGSGWRQALVQEGASLYQWHQQRWRGRTRWVRAACLRFDPADGQLPAAEPARKLAQVTGERDTQPGATDRTLSASWSASGVRGTDLGARVDHAGESYLLFGDTHWRARTRTTRDVLGRVTSEGPVPGLPGVALHGSPTRIVGGPATSREYDVPLDGFSAGADLFVFFSSHHFQRHQVMGRSLLTRSVARRPPVDPRQRRRPLDFEHLGTFSDRFFVNVACVRRGDRVYLWGSGSYRADDLRLAELDLCHPDVTRVLAGRGTLRRPQGGVRFWAGCDASGAARWSPAEDDAKALLPGAFGEISVRWVEPLRRYVLLAMSGPEDPLGPCVTLRTAPQPWGPWTPRRPLFDWIVSGMSHHDEASRFIRAHADDPVGDAIFSPQRAMTGAAYAPHVFSADVATDGRLALRFTLSTWNPYQVVLMESLLDLPPAD